MNSKLNKFIQKPIEWEGKLVRRPVLLTSSKGFSLSRNLDIARSLGIEFQIVSKAGARFADYLPWLYRNLQGLVSTHGQITLYIWLGTCDLTVKRGPFIELRHSTDENAQLYLLRYINEFRNFVSSFPTVKLVFIEIPPYSIVEWNRFKGHSDPDSFQSQEKSLRDRILFLNDYLHSVNAELGVRSPSLRVDLLHYRKSRNKETRRVSVNFSLYKDGIHPGKLLARVWFKKIVVAVVRDCVC